MERKSLSAPHAKVSSVAPQSAQSLRSFIAPLPSVSAGAGQSAADRTLLTSLLAILALVILGLLTALISFAASTDLV